MIAERDTTHADRASTQQTTAKQQLTMSLVHAAAPTMHSAAAPEQCPTSLTAHSSSSSGSAQQPRLEDHHPKSFRSRLLSFRVTGAASVARLEPLLLGREWRNREQRVEWLWAPGGGGSGGGGSVAGARIDFVWETTVAKQQLKDHRNATVLNRLSGAQVLEDKASLALLQRLMTAPTLDSYVAKGRAEVARWAHLHYQRHADAPPSPYLREGEPHANAPPSCYVGEDTSREDGRIEDGQDQETMQQGARVVTQAGGGGGAGGGSWWCVKAAGGNGGMDIWVLHKDNWRAVTQNLRDGESYVIQRYVARPLLWRGRKFHFRAYAAVRADMSAWLYRTAYILCASKPYSLERGGGEEATTEGREEGLTDELMHISNLAVNKHTEGHPGQVPCNLPKEYPTLWPQMLELVRSLVEAAGPFMQHQTSVGHFEFLGLDIIADEEGGVWLMEANRLPGLQSSKQNLEDENKVYDGMMLDLIRLLVLPPLTGCSPDQGLFEEATGPSLDAKAPSEETWRNVMRFAAFKRTCARKSPPP